MAQRGRKTIYTPALADQICEKLADGLSLGAVCKLPGMPKSAAIFEWLTKYPEFAEKYARAREAQAEKLAEEIIEIADEECVTVKRADVAENGEGGDDQAVVEVVFDSVAVQRNRLRVDARKWYASKLAPKKYGDKVEATLQGPGGGPVRHDVTLSPVDAYKKLINGE